MKNRWRFSIGLIGVVGLLLLTVTPIRHALSRAAKANPSPAAVPQQTVPAVTAPARTVKGIATTQDGKPLAHVTLYLFGLPPGETDMITLGDQSTVVTDDQGHFTWNVPAALPPLSDYIGVRSIDCYALAADRSTEQFRLALRPNLQGTDADQGNRSLLEGATRPCETKWLTNGPHPVFSVIVPDTSTVLLTVRGPDGQPLREREIQAASVEPSDSYGGAVVYTGRTDTEGRLRLRCFPGSLKFQVFVPGLGFGATGTFQADPGQPVVPDLPPLAPFATVSGTVDPALIAPGAAVSLGLLFPENAWYVPSSAVDAGGHWTLTDVLPEIHQLVLTGGRGEIEPMQITTHSGEQMTGITILPKKPANEAGTPSAPTVAASSPTVRGQVTDAAGRPVAGADVFAICSSGMIRGQKVLTAKTDAAGRYVIPGIPTDTPNSSASVGFAQNRKPEGPFVHLVAHVPGSGLAAAEGQSEQAGGSGPWQDIEKDLVLPESHAGLTVRVLQNGKPVPNILVELSEVGEDSLTPAEYVRDADRGEAAQTLRALLSPSAKTGSDGAVRFENLTPGMWEVTANRARPYGFEPLVTPSNTSKGVAVQAGIDQSYTLSLLPPPGQIAFHAVGPDGLPPIVPPDRALLTTAQYPNAGMFALNPDGTENMVASFNTPGLFQARLRYGSSPVDPNTPVGPYDEGSALVAVSAATPSRSPILVSGKRLGPASLRVHLVDGHGKPLHGSVTVGSFPNETLYAASVDARGVAVFPNVPLNFFPYIVTAHIDGRPDTAKLASPSGLLPSDAALMAGTGQPLPQSVVVRGGEETEVTLGPQATGYVRLRLTGPQASAHDYNIETRQSNDEPFTNVRMDPATGDYLIGPLPPGPRTLHLFRNLLAPVDAELDAGKVLVTVKSGQVVDASMTPQSTSAQEIVDSSPLTGTVFLADGKTPAWGARAALFVPDRTVPLRMARTDPQGHLTLRDYWRDNARTFAPSGDPSDPVVVAWLPGANGAVIVPFQPGHDLHLVLAPAITLHGRVSVGGKSVLGLPSQFRVRAAYVGKGRLNTVLTVEATAQADGTFTLAGLTPGTYQVQAARDNIWMSRTQMLTVGAKALPEMTLDIAPPGAPVILKIVDGHGKPLPEQSVKIARPEGPLTDEIWPGALMSDATGHLRVDGLEAGHHLMTKIGRDTRSIGFDVPAWTPTAPPGGSQTASRRIVR